MTETQSLVATPAPAGPASPRSRLRLARFRDLALVPAILLLVLVGAIIDPVFLSQANIINVMQQQIELSLLVLAESIILIAGKFDLSLESTIGLAPALSLGLVIPTASHGLGTDWPTALAIPLCLLIGAVIGAFNGLLILRFKLSAIIVTLGMLIVLRGLQIGLTGGQNLFDIPPSVLYLGNAVVRPPGVDLDLRGALRGRDRRAGFPPARPGRLRDRRQRRRGPGRRDPHRPGGLDRSDHRWSARLARRTADDRPAGVGGRDTGPRHDLHGVRGGRDRRDQPRRRQGHPVRCALRRHRARADQQHPDSRRRFPRSGSRPSTAGSSCWR